MQARRAGAVQMLTSLMKRSASEYRAPPSTTLAPTRPAALCLAAVVLPLLSAVPAPRPLAAAHSPLSCVSCFAFARRRNSVECHLQCTGSMQRPHGCQRQGSCCCPLRALPHTATAAVAGRGTACRSTWGAAGLGGRELSGVAAGAAAVEAACRGWPAQVGAVVAVAGAGATCVQSSPLPPLHSPA